MIARPTIAGLGITLCALAAWSAAAPATEAGSAPDAERFVALYAEACLPERFSFDGTLVHAQKLGWSDRNLHTYDAYGAVMRAAREAYEAETADGFVAQMRIAGLVREDGGRTYHLIATEMLSKYLDSASCYLYDFEATAPIDPAPVTALLEHPIAYSTDGTDPFYAQPATEIVSVVWGPPEKFPRMFDTYLTFLPQGSPHTEFTGFSGLMIKSTTSLY